LAFFGDGATSSNDFHAAMNWAGVRGLPVLFCCANNQWAISLPVSRQTGASSLAAKAHAYGFEGSRVDGTDLFQVWSALKGALDAARQDRGPQLLEFELFRMTPHSSSDDPTRYQPAGWMELALARDPLERVARWLESTGWLDASARAAIEARIDTSIRAAIKAAESAPPPPPSSLMEDTYAQPLSLPADLGRELPEG
jgi:TPP-dependent pyruvate/acetoin dehydrogenase alpha subunit